MGSGVLAFWRKSVWVRFLAMGHLLKLGKIWQDFEEKLFFGAGACKIICGKGQGGGFGRRSDFTFDAVRRLAPLSSYKISNCQFI